MATNKVVLITGAARRIGAAIARVLHAQGMQLILHYRSSQDEAHELQAELNECRPNSVILVQAELLTQKGLPSLVRKAINNWGQLDALINNASSFYATPMGNITEGQWEELIGSNLKVPFFLSQAAAPYLKMTRGCIVNILDIHAERPLKDYSVYSIAKAGLVMVTRSLARELGPEVRVNGVSPGAILWPENDLDEVTKQRIISRTFLKCQGGPSDIAQAVLFLINQAQYITGQIITIDGGRSLNS